MKSRPNPSAVPLFIPLESVSVASPCNADWEAMQGDDRSRFCSGCAKNVYNLSALTKNEAEALLLEKEGKLCVRYFQRPDGTMLTQDCPIGLLRANEAQLQPPFAFWANAVTLRMIVAALVVGALSPIALLAQPYRTTGAPVASVAPPASSATPTPAPTPTATPISPPDQLVLGRIAVPPKPTATPAPVQVDMGIAAINEIRGEAKAAPKSARPTLKTSIGKVAVPPVCAPVQPEPGVSTTELPDRIQTLGEVRIAPPQRKPTEREPSIKSS